MDLNEFPYGHPSYEGYVNLKAEEVVIKGDVYMYSDRHHDGLSAAIKTPLEWWGKRTVISLVDAANLKLYGFYRPIGGYRQRIKLNPANSRPLPLP